MVVGRYGGMENRASRFLLISCHVTPNSPWRHVPIWQDHRRTRIDVPNSWAATTCWPIQECPGLVLPQIHLHAVLSIQFVLQWFSLPWIIVSEDEPIEIYVTAAWRLCRSHRASQNNGFPAGRREGKVAARKGRSNPDLMAFLVRIPGIQTTRRAHDSVPI